jgi:hypothetical protein
MSKKLKLFIFSVVFILVAIVAVILLFVFRDDIKNTIVEIRDSFGASNRSGEAVDLKPVIYLYPLQEERISVKLNNYEHLTHTYPKYEDGWDVIAKPNGDLIDLKTGRNLYCLYWEGINSNDFNMNEGFVIKGEDTTKFLEEKLAILGLTEREANEFIIYWLPKLESNKYNFIRFRTYEEINENMGLTITPAPDTLIRVMMEFKPLNEEIDVKEQVLATPQRNGFVAVEWGGTEIK